MKIAYVMIMVMVTFGVAYGLGHEVARPKHPLRVSVGAVQEIMQECSGNFRDLAANRQYVYANCVTPNGPKPVTIQNYRMK